MAQKFSPIVSITTAENVSLLAIVPTVGGMQVKVYLEQADVLGALTIDSAETLIQRTGNKSPVVIYIPPADFQELLDITNSTQLGFLLSLVTSVGGKPNYLGLPVQLTPDGI